MCKCGGADEHNHQITEQTKNLVKFIDLPKCKILNSKQPELLEKALINPENENYMQSDLDNEILIRILFNSNIKLKAIAIRSNAKSLKCFTNNENLSFSSCQTTTPQQAWSLVDFEGVVEYPTKIFKFSNVSSLTLLLEDPSEPIKIFYIGFIGDVLDLKRAPVIADYELRPNLSDHKTGGLFDVEFSNRF
jgi:hypothetical protein